MDEPSSSRELFAPLTIEITPSTKNDTNQLQKELLNGIRGLKVKPPMEKDKLKIKLEYKDEKRCIAMGRPIKIEALRTSVKKLFNQTLSVYYSQGKHEVLIAINNQDDLDHAIEVVDRNGLRSLKLLLSQHKSADTFTHGMQPDASGTYITSVQEVPYTESCSSCAAGRMSLNRSLAGISSGSSGIHLDSDDWRNNSSSPRAPLAFKKGKKIGSGSYGSVFVAHDVDTGQDVALKCVPIIPLNREAGKEAQGLEHDVRELARLRHPHILQYLGVQITREEILIFMEYMPGGSVKDLIEVEGQLSHKVSIKYTGQVLDGLAFLHKKHIVHRDIKPANILRDLNANVKIADFGSGKKLQTLATHQDGFLGTVLYTAPEVLLGKSAYGRKADVWSVGVSLVEMLTGNAPWNGLEQMAAMFNIIYEEPDINYEMIKNDNLEDLVKHLLAKDPNERPMAEEVLLNHVIFKN